MYENGADFSHLLSSMLFIKWDPPLVPWLSVLIPSRWSQLYHSSARSVVITWRCSLITVWFLQKVDSPLSENSVSVSSPLFTSFITELTHFIFICPAEAASMLLTDGFLSFSLSLLVEFIQILWIEWKAYKQIKDGWKARKEEASKTEQAAVVTFKGYLCFFSFVLVTH